MDLKRAALGEAVVTLGTLYDARNDTFLSASVLKSPLPSDALQVTKIDKFDVEVFYGDVQEKEFEAMSISTDLGLSILTGLTAQQGSSIFLLDQPDNHSLSAKLHHTLITTKETLNFGFTELKNLLAAKDVPSGHATHALVAIDWGVRSVVAAHQPSSRRMPKNVAENMFQSDFVTFQSIVEALTRGEHLTDHLRTTTGPDEPMEVTVYSDVLENDGIIVEDLQGGYEFLELVTLYAKEKGGGKGFPITYSLLPIEALALFLPSLGQIFIGRYVRPSSECSSQFLRLFNDFQSCEQILDGLQKRAGANAKYLHSNVLQSIITRKEKRNSALELMKTKLRQTLQSVRGGSDPGPLWQLLSEFQEGELSPRNLSNIEKSVQQSIDFPSDAVSKGATYIGHNGITLDDLILKFSHGDNYVFFFKPNFIENDCSWQANQDILFELLETKRPGGLIAIVDCEAISMTLDRVRIAHFQGGQEVNGDLLEHRHFIADKCFATCNEQTVQSKNIRKPIQRRHVAVPCPGVNCAMAEIREWICPRCEAPIEYGFSDKFLYCECGRSLYSNYSFKCNNESHGPSYALYDLKHFLRLLNGLCQSKYLNILILGETGVGKSTFINALVNYLEFETLDDAIGFDKLNYLIPCSFSTQVMDRDNPSQPIQEKRIKVGSRDDEKDGSRGDSATQRTQVYPVTFNMGDSTQTVRLIDTPGMGDTRGVDFDRKNMADILSTLSGYDELHGILILLKSNSARLTISFSYCIKELLTHLHHNAAKNMAFGFTNTRISNYTPGDTYGPLKALLQQRPDMGLSLSTPTTYCFDSESFRYLAALKNGVPMPNKLDFDRSWKHSRDESLRLISHFKQNIPHKVKNTVSLNGARQLIGELTKPIAEISQLIHSNIALTEDKMQELKDERLTGDQLRDRLHVQKIQMSAVPLAHPRTVCGNAACVEVRSDGTEEDKTVTIYKAHCHGQCGLRDVQADQLAHPGLIRCWAFSGSQYCRQCRHHWQEHLHILYELVEKTVTAVDGTIQQKLASHANDLTLRETALKQHDQRISEYKQEREKIRDAAAKFGVFLKKYSLAPYNDALIAYLDYLIKEEQMKVQAGGSNKRLLSFTEERHKHTEAIKVITENLNSNANWETMSEGAIDRMVQSLYKLKHFGSTLENLRHGIATAHEATYREIPFIIRRKHGRDFRCATKPPEPHRHHPMPVAPETKSPVKVFFRRLLKF
ncbi:hypothetical protein HYFRA_00001704 [Hymenoscyphus fraxineus]|uniref:G domain-containing protein n=1 Tax=Hymenoscyphus fraxineus TaxID=746836 RepID=A0A9N9PU26_9HELO|nr:hypothetical protein HYFRA_00001704 [Hymenoscyphus fraxineus]